MVSDVFNMLMYADDTTLYCNINQNISKIEINHELWKVSQWLAANKLSLNVGKTKFMVFRMRNKVVSYPDLQINGNAIERVTQFNFLGLILHESLSWDKHINHISLKVSKAIGILYRLKSIYPHRVLLTLYNTLILPHYNYCILSWGSTLTLSDPGYFRQLTIRGGGGFKSPPYDLENYCVNLHYIIHVNFNRCFWHDPIGIF